MDIDIPVGDGLGGGEDHALLALAAGGDRAALGRIFDRHGAAVAALAASLAPHADAADDVVSDVFARLWRRAPALQRGGVALRPWLAVTTLARSRRTSRAEHAGIAGDDPATPAAVAPGVGAAVAMALAGGEGGAALDGLARWFALDRCALARSAGDGLRLMGASARSLMHEPGTADDERGVE